MSMTEPGLSPSRIDAIRRELQPLISAHCREIVNPIQRIPNVKHFEVSVLSDYHPIFLEKGIYKRQYKPVFDIDPYRNGAMNRYLEHQFLRLNKHRTDPATFWRIAERLLKRSNVYLTLLQYEVSQGWHRHLDYDDIKSDLRAYKSLNLADYSVRHHGIPKPDGTKRYLCIAPKPWRLYQRGLQHIMQVWLSPYSHPFQHGYQPGRGVDTAWQQIHYDLLGKQAMNVYEFDLKKYFDSINLDYLRRILLSLQIPSLLVNHIINWNRRAPTNGDPLSLTWKSTLQEAQDYKYHQTGEYLITCYAEEELWLNKKRKATLSNPDLSRYSYFHGIHQGSGLSPLLSTLPISLDLLNNPEIRVVSYADDGVIYGFSDTDTPELYIRFSPESGIEINEDKSGWIRQRGVWEHPLKFLGRKYEYSPDDPDSCQGGLISNNTRTPRPFVLRDYALVSDAHNWDINRCVISPPEPLNRDGTPKKTWEDWFTTVYFGYIGSCISNGTYETSTVAQCFTYTYKESSWSYLESHRYSESVRKERVFRINGRRETVRLDLFNSSSFAHRALNYWLRHTFVSGGPACTGFLR
jgi:hypothetical protein